MMLRYLGWTEAADFIHTGVSEAIQNKFVTADFYEQMESATLTSTSVFADQVISRM
jgi:isocitrate dehydrogenase